jgi:steroid delta-isomerase-like uncharacterized protein
MPNDPETIVHEWFELVWNQHREDEIDRLLAADAVVHGLTDAAGNDLLGPAGFRPFYATFRRTFPDLRIDVEDYIADGDKVAFRCVARGTHLGDDLGIAATRQPIEMAGMGFVRVANGQIAEAWNTFDFHGLFTQLRAAANP